MNSAKKEERKAWHAIAYESESRCNPGARQNSGVCLILISLTQRPVFIFFIRDNFSKLYKQYFNV